MPKLQQLEARVKRLEDALLARELERTTYSIAHNITQALLAKGDDWDLDLLAKMTALLGVDLVELTNKAPKAVKDVLDTNGKKRKARS